MKLAEEKILVTGASGFLGSHVVQVLKESSCQNVRGVTSKEYDLREKEQVFDLFTIEKPSVVFSLAAKVGGILDNKNAPAEFYYDNILIGAYVYEASRKFNVKKLVNVGAGCGYPLALKEPLREEDIWEGFPQPESAPYSLAKKMLILQSIAYRKQYGLSAITIIPSNIYGEHDNFHLEKSHVIPALVRKFFEARKNGHSEIKVWGDGSAKRDFIHAYDVASGLVQAAASYDDSLPINVCTGYQHSIKEVVDLLKEISGYTGKIVWDTTKPSGQSSRLMSVENRDRHLDKFRLKYSLRDGLMTTYNWLADNYESGTVRL
jgi:GDP-L-fucose synthase